MKLASFHKGTGLQYFAGKRLIYTIWRILMIRKAIFTILFALVFTTTAYAQEVPVTLFVSETDNNYCYDEGVQEQGYRWQYQLSAVQTAQMDGEYYVNVDFGGEEGYVSQLFVRDGLQFGDADGGSFTLCPSRAFPDGELPTTAEIHIYTSAGYLGLGVEILGRSRTPVIHERLYFPPQNGEQIEIVIWPAAHQPSWFNQDTCPGGIYDYQIKIGDALMFSLDQQAEDNHVYAALFDGTVFTLAVAHLWLNENVVSSNSDQLCFDLPPTDGQNLRVLFSEGNEDEFEIALTNITVLQ